MRPRVLIGSGAFGLFLLLGGAGEALACSCVGGDIKPRYAWSDAAVVAELTSVENVSPQKAEYTYEIADVYKRRDRFKPGDELMITAASGGASCGLPRRTEREYGLFLYRAGGQWNANLCTTTDAEGLRRWGEKHRPGGGAGSMSRPVSAGSATSGGLCPHSGKNPPQADLT